MATRDDDLPTLDVTSRGTRFVDGDGRTLTLRGVNLGGAKLPFNYMSDGDYKLERAPDAVGGYCILRYTPGPPGYVSIVVVKRVGADDPPGRSCCAHSPDEALLPSKPSSETLLEM